MCGTKVRQQIHVRGAVRRKWTFLEKEISPKCFAAILGIGNLRVQRLMGGHVDRRFKVWGGVTCIHIRCPVSFALEI